MLFTSPITLNDGTADHIFSFHGQKMDPKSFIGVWKEYAADVSAASSITVKHDESSASLRRRLVQRTVNVVVDETIGSKPITVNFTVLYHPNHATADVLKQIAIMKDGLAEATFPANFLQGQL